MASEDARWIRRLGDCLSFVLWVAAISLLLTGIMLCAKNAGLHHGL